jgi:hypothetical protein
MSNATATAVLRGASFQQDFEWEFLDEHLGDRPQRYGSIFEMHAAPLRLTGTTAGKFAALKQRRVPRSAKPLSLD